MIRSGRSIAVVLSACLAAGCVLPTSARKGTGGIPSEQVIRAANRGTVIKPGGSPTPARTPVPPPTGLSGAGLVSNNGAGIVSNNAGSLSGLVRCPAGLISNNGGGIISNNSGGYHVLGTVTEAPLKGVTVHLLDAEGKILMGQDGKPLTAVTDAQGNYSFKGILPGNNLLLVVDLGDKGQLKAIATKSGGTERKSDINLISTLTTGYILDQYVKGQSDPQKTLDKLPANVESETRAKASAAFAANGVAAPADLTTTSVVQTVTAMRHESTTFDAQMEDVKKLLIAAGQSDLGAGRAALEVDLDMVDRLFLSPAQELEIVCGQDRRVWRVDGQGKIQPAAGKGVASAASLNGVAGPDAGLGRFLNVAQDAQGRLLLLENSLVEESGSFPDTARLSRLGTDGKLSELWKDVPAGAEAVVPGTGDEALVFISNADGAIELWAVTAGQAAQKRTTFDQATTTLLEGYLETIASDAQGNLYVDAADENGNEALYKMAAGGTTFTKVFDVPDTALSSLDPRGNMFLWNDDDSYTVRKTDGTVVTLLDASPAGVDGGSIDAALLLGDGSAYLSINTKVYLVKNKAATAIAGTGTTTATGKATEIAVKPAGMAIGPDGSIYFSDATNDYIMRLGTDAQVTRFAGSDTGADDPADGTPALSASLFATSAVRTDAAGNVYVVADTLVYKIDTQGKLYTVYRCANVDEDNIDDVIVGSDGSLFLVEQHAPQNSGTVAMRLERLAPGATQATVLKEDVTDNAAFAFAADGAGFYVAEAGGKLSHWTAAGGFQAIATNALFDALEIGAGGMTVDAKGRVIFSTGATNKVMRFDTVSKAFTTLAGAGSKFFTGNTVDTSIDGPSFPLFDKDGNLLFADTGHRQIKRIPASEL